jgi:hypothetical protein
MDISLLNKAFNCYLASASFLKQLFYASKEALTTKEKLCTLENLAD